MANRAIALARSTHPGPAIAVTIVAIVLAVGAGLEPWRVILVGLAVAANQASVGLSNDWLDAERDTAVGRTDKPVALGQVTATAVRNASIVAAIVAIVLTVPLGWLATIAHTVFIGSAWSYNAGLKKTVFSLAPYIVSFGILPAVVTLASADPRFAAPWILATGALLGIAAHFANVLPDLDDDKATGVRGLPHRFGRRALGVTTYVVLAVATVTAVLGAGALGSATGLAALLVNGVLAATGIALAARPTRLHFRLIIAAALVIVAMLAFAGELLYW